ncbi:type II secretion system F family protein [Hyphobacterium sp.]|uniref:type II secretion system F family protein n=1 Tax=Hyphobacterium sp. TaxID=2004662 RepID=UPI003BAD9ED4
MNGQLPLLFAAVAAFFAVGGVGWVVAGALSDGQKSARKKAVMSASGGRKPRKAEADSSQNRKKQVAESLKEIEDKQKSAKKKSLTLKSRIAQAGFTFSVQTFWIASGVLAILGFLGAFMTGQSFLISGGLAIAAGLGLPRWFLSMRRAGRQKKFTAEFANALDIIVRGIKSGLPLNECIKVIAREAPDPVGPEFAKLVEAQAVGVSLEDGTKKMVERMPLPELNFFSTVLTIQAKTGGNLAEALGNLSAVLRSRKMMREKIGALSSEAKASAMIIGALPPGVLAIVYFTTPSYMTAMFVEPKGQLMLLGGAMWMGLGILMMRGMINFKH